MVFKHLDGRPLSESTLSSRFKAQLLMSHLPPVTFHSLRHSSITYKLILSHGNIKAVQGDSGHAQAEMVTELYGHIQDSSRKENALRFQEDFYQALEWKTTQMLSSASLNRSRVFWHLLQNSNLLRPLRSRTLRPSEKSHT